MTRGAAVLFGSLTGYRPRWLRRDLVAGLTVWVVLVPRVAGLRHDRRHLAGRRPMRDDAGAGLIVGGRDGMHGLSWPGVGTR
jgi:hypothetical protein